jgi:predicted nucleic acid-binding protein
MSCTGAGDVHFFDTNVLLYSISLDPTEAAKRERALALLERDDGALSIQVLQEFYVQATRITRRTPVPHDTAVDLVTGWTRFRVQDMTPSILSSALEIRERYRYAYWDCAVIAAARALGWRELYSEDLQHGHEIDGVRIVNPFL